MFIKYNSFGLLWAVVILFLSVVGVETNANIEFHAMDKIIHLCMYLVLCMMLIVGFTKQFQIRVLKYNPMSYAIVFASAFGILMEVVQFFLPSRSFDVLDMLANIVGAFIGWIVFMIVYKL